MLFCDGNHSSKHVQHTPSLSLPRGAATRLARGDGKTLPSDQIESKAQAYDNLSFTEPVVKTPLTDSNTREEQKQAIRIASNQSPNVRVNAAAAAAKMMPEGRYFGACQGHFRP